MWDHVYICYVVIYRGYNQGGCWYIWQGNALSTVLIVPSGSSLKLKLEPLTLKDEKVFFNLAESFKSEVQARKETIMTCCSFKDSYHCMWLFPSFTQEKFKALSSDPNVLIIKTLMSTAKDH